MQNKVAHHLSQLHFVELMQNRVRFISCCVNSNMNFQRAVGYSADVMIGWHLSRCLYRPNAKKGIIKEMETGAL